MNIANPPASVLTHGGDSESAITSTLKTHTETLQAQHDKMLMAGATGVIPVRHMHYEEPELAPQVNLGEDLEIPEDQMALDLPPVEETKPAEEV